ncbi:MAG: putative glycoside hydrolase [Patescibacteria group bacterium]
MQRIFPTIIAILILTSFLYPLNFGQMEEYPKLANLFYSWQLSDQDITNLAKWDLVVLDMDQQVRNPDKIRRLRQLNPQIKILAYLASQEIKEVNLTSESYLLSRQLADSIPVAWYLKDAAGNKISWWSGSWLLNISDYCPLVNGDRWNTFLPKFINTKIMSSGLWDGVLLDNTWDNISYFISNYDLDNNCSQDTASVADPAWRNGEAVIIDQTRNLIGKDKIIIGNGTTCFGNRLNGVVFENFPYSWSNDQSNYLKTSAYSGTILHIVNANTANTGNQADYQKMRFGLTSTLLGNGLYSFDFGDTSHGQTWWFDEYDVALGQPTSGPQDVLHNNSTTISSGVWRRDFEKGVVFVNSTNDRQAVNLGREELEKIKGTQDPLTNDGSIINYLRLNSNDGILLLKPLAEIIGSTFVNGSFVRIFDNTGQRQRGGFFTYKAQYPGSSQILTTDIDVDGSLETLIAGDRSVAIYNSAGTLETTFYPYGEKYNKGINLSFGDLNGDGTIEIITGTEKGGGPQIRVFNAQGRLINPGFFAYGSDYRGGVNVAVGDLNGDGTSEIIAGAGVGGGPQIRIFNKDGKLLSAGWFAFDANFRGGVNVAVGDINGDGAAEIVAAPGYGGKPEVKVYDSRGKQLGNTFLAFDVGNRDGIEVMVNDINGDNQKEILTTSLSVF